MSEGPVPVTQADEVASLRRHLTKMQAAGELDLPMLKLGLDYATEIGVSMNDLLSLVLDFAEPSWLQDLGSDTQSPAQNRSSSRR